MVIVGWILCVFGVVDLIGSFAGFDLWGTLGVTLPEVLWRLSSWIEIALGAYLIKQGNNAADS